jgi:ornithine carbamoyltransferase
MKGRHFLQIADWTRDELSQLLTLAAELKRKLKAGEEHRLLPGRALGMVFDKPSTRTRISFEVGMAQLGGTALFLQATDLQFGHGETIRDTGVVLSRFLDAIMIRTYDQAAVEELAAGATVPVINGLTDSSHPCQALADLLTMRERFGDLAGRKLLYVGDGNNTCASLIVAAATFGMDVVVACPRGYEPPEAAVEAARERGAIELVRDAGEAAAGAHVLYTDTWVSMGQENERVQRLRDLGGYAIDADLLARAESDAIVMHCLPAHYGEEVTEEILHGPRSAAWDEAENRLHAQKALLATIVP